MEGALTAALFLVVWTAAVIPLGIFLGKMASAGKRRQAVEPYVCAHGHTDSDDCPVCCH